MANQLMQQSLSRKDDSVRTRLAPATEPPRPQGAVRTPWFRIFALILPITLLLSLGYSTDPSFASGSPGPAANGAVNAEGDDGDDGSGEVGGSSSQIFVDVPTTYWARAYIEELYVKNYVTGCNIDPPMFCPEKTMNRAESAVFVERGRHGAGFTPSQPSFEVFSDLPLQNWAAKWATALYDDGFTSGCGKNPLSFCPWDGHTRAEGAVFFLRMKNGQNYDPPAAVGIFADVPIHFWSAKWVEAAYNQGLMPACETTKRLRFCPDDPLTRAMAAYVMVQAKGGLPLP